MEGIHRKCVSFSKVIIALTLFSVNTRVRYIEYLCFMQYICIHNIKMKQIMKIPICDFFLKDHASMVYDLSSNIVYMCSVTISMPH